MSKAQDLLKEIGKVDEASNSRLENAVAGLLGNINMGMEGVEEAMYDAGFDLKTAKGKKWARIERKLEKVANEIGGFLKGDLKGIE